MVLASQLSEWETACFPFLSVRWNHPYNETKISVSIATLNIGGQHQSIHLSTRKTIRLYSNSCFQCFGYLAFFFQRDKTIRIYCNAKILTNIADHLHFQRDETTRLYCNLSQAFSLVRPSTFDETMQSVSIATWTSCRVPDSLTIFNETKQSASIATIHTIPVHHGTRTFNETIQSVSIATVNILYSLYVASLSTR